MLDSLQHIVDFVSTPSFIVEVLAIVVMLIWILIGIDHFIIENRPISLLRTAADIELYHQHLTPTEQDELRRRSSITVRGSLGGSYTIYLRGNRNVVDRYYSYCLVFKGVNSEMDILIAKKLLIQSSERTFLTNANWMRKIRALHT